MHAMAGRCALVASGVVMVSFLVGCAGAGRVGDGFVLEPEKLVDEQAPRPMAGRLVILDVRPREQYAQGHVKGSTWVDIKEWTELSRAPKTGLENVAGWRKLLAMHGISGDDRVVILDDGTMKEAARAWFILQHAGVRRAVVLDGGWRAALAVGVEPIGIGAPPRPTPCEFKAASRSSPVVLADKGAMQRCLGDADAQILDVRTADEFVGREKRKNPRGGHLPGAVNLPHERLFDSAGRLKPSEEVDRLLADAGLQKNRPLVLYCDGGGRSSLVALAALRAGYGPVSNYYRSFSEWSADQTCPVETP